MDLLKLTDIAINAARSAAEIIQKHISEDVTVIEKEGGTSRASQIVTEVDLACEKVILSHLLPSCKDFDLALLSEESEDNGSRFEKDYFWCIDPMDGTLAFINKQPGFSISIALVAKDGTPQIGVVLDPSTGNLYHAIKGYGAYKNGVSWEVNCNNKHLTYVTDRLLKDTPNADEIASLLKESAKKLGLSGIKEISGSGAVLNAIFVLENGPACMLKFPKKEPGGGSIWDYAATACIYEELGLKATNYAGGKLDLNRKNSTFMNHEGVFYANFDGEN